MLYHSYMFIGFNEECAVTCFILISDILVLMWSITFTSWNKLMLYTFRQDLLRKKLLKEQQDRVKIGVDYVYRQCELSWLLIFVTYRQYIVHCRNFLAFYTCYFCVETGFISCKPTNIWSISQTADFRNFTDQLTVS